MSTSDVASCGAQVVHAPGEHHVGRALRRTSPDRRAIRTHRRACSPAPSACEWRDAAGDAQASCATAASRRLRRGTRPYDATPRERRDAVERGGREVVGEDEGETHVPAAKSATLACDNRPFSSIGHTASLSPYELAVGLRYTRARKGSGRNTFISFISLISMAGIALGVAALIVVLSVMNGFQEELRNRILSVASHIEIRGCRSSWTGNGRRDGVEGAAREGGRAVRARAGDAHGERRQSRRAHPRHRSGARGSVADIGKHMRRGSLADLKPGEFGIVLGATSRARSASCRAIPSS
jgi:hypothetical protein